MHCTKSRTTDNRSIVAVKFIEIKKITNLHLNKLKKLFIVNHINFIHEYKHCWYVNLVCKKDMFTCLRHWTVISGNHKNCTVHLGSTCNHILDIVSVTRAVNVCIVTCRSLIFNVSSVNGNTPFLFFRCIIN